MGRANKPTPPPTQPNGDVQPASPAHPASKGEILVRVLVVLVIALVGYLNFTRRGQSHPWFYWADHLSYFSKRTALVWTIGAMVLAWFHQPIRALLAKWIPLPRRWACAAALAGITALMVWSFIAWRTPYPACHGDGGEISIADVTGKLKPDFKKYPAYEGRLHNYLDYWMRQAFHPAGTVGTGYLSKLDRENGQTHKILWRQACFWMGTLACVIVALWLFGQREKLSVSPIALFVLLATSPPLLNAYGHYDSYMPQILFLFLWLVCLALSTKWLQPVEITRAGGGIRGLTGARITLRADFFAYLAGVAGTTLLGAWLHPILMICLPYLFTFIFFLFIERTGRRIHWVVVLVITILLSLLPAFSPDLDQMLRRPEYRMLALRTHGMNTLQVAAPALLGALLLIGLNLRRFARMTANAAMGLVMIGSGTAYCLTLNFAFGYGDELLYAIPGGIILIGVVLVLTRFNGGEAVAWPAAILSAYLFVPHAALYARFEMMERGSAIAPKEVGAYAIDAKITPYVQAGLRVAVDDPKVVDLRLRTFWAGWSNPLPPFNGDPDKLLCLHYYIAWAFDCGRDEDGTKALLLAFNANINSVVALWLNGTCLTGYNENVAYKKIRAVSHQIIEENIARGEQVQTLTRAREVLNEIERKNP